jgi:hypothetical protein
MEKDYPQVKKAITKPPPYTPIDEDMPKIQKVLNDPNV